MNLGETDLTPKETEALLNLCKESKGDTYMEIGVYAGGTLSKVVELHKFKKAIGIDLFEDFIPSEDNTHISGSFSLNQVNSIIPESLVTISHLIKNDSSKAWQFVEPFQGVIFIDGNHTYNATLVDLITSCHLLKKGHILLHNASNTEHPDIEYIKRDGGVYEVVQFAKLLPYLKYITTVERLAIFEK